ncbi:MAG TPA: tRNA (adenosine(37)-N6)-threonylcarbamoyltransferase complex ATPase subunit type 1 TsaE [Flavobacteriaceae bacterium]|nr:tRNA (adenosine(37)-N6)-threonylcarbamoyltransferase complex ATPase subunit type 1 TsaE [Flavobacteriaceae bacterium]
MITYFLEDIDDVAKKIVERSASKTLLFNGEMGVGKTTLIKAIVKALGSKDEVSSPTFSIVNEYESSEGTVYHFDLYRVQKQTELLDFGIEEYLDKDAWCLIEWPELIKDYLDTGYEIVTITKGANASREIKITFNS